MNKVVHFEIPADDMDRAKRFYSEIFEWQINDLPEMNYVTLGTVEVDEERMPLESGAINGGMTKRDSKIPNPVITIDVDDIDETMERIISRGGEEVQGKMEVFDMGWSAYFKDSEGNIMGLWQNKPE